MPNRKNFISRYLMIGAPTALAVFTVLHFSHDLGKVNFSSGKDGSIAVTKPSDFQETRVRRTLASTGNSTAATGASCGEAEIPGAGPASTLISESDWQRTLDQFHTSKARLLSWLGTHHGSLSDPTIAKMRAQIDGLKIFRPATTGEPDLAWRGVGVFESADSVHGVKIGPGLVSLIKRDPARGQFEMTRLVAQAWSPCELEKIKAGAPWALAMECLGVKDTEACTAGHNSEGGWAISTALASIIHPPGCVIPAFRNASAESCFDAAAPVAQAVTRKVASDGDEVTTQSEGEK